MISRLFGRKKKETNGAQNQSNEADEETTGNNEERLTTTTSEVEEESEKEQFSGKEHFNSPLKVPKLKTTNKNSNIEILIMTYTSRTGETTELKKQITSTHTHLIGTFYDRKRTKITEEVLQSSDRTSSDENGSELDFNY